MTVAQAATQEATIEELNAELERLTGCRYVPDMAPLGEWMSSEQVKAMGAAALDSGQLKAALWLAVQAARAARGHAVPAAPAYPTINPPLTEEQVAAIEAEMEEFQRLTGARAVLELQGADGWAPSSVLADQGELRRFEAVLLLVARAAYEKGRQAGAAG